MFDSHPRPPSGSLSASTPFPDRTHAGRLLVRRLMRFQQALPMVLAVPDGGHAVGRPIPEALHVRLYGLGEWEGGESAVFARDVGRFRERLGGRRMRWPPSRSHLRVERAERARSCLDGVPSPAGRVVILVVDGLSPDEELQALVDVLRDLGAERIVVVAPVLPMAAAEVLSGSADEVIALTLPRVFGTADTWYDHDPDSISGASMPIR